MHAKRGVGRGSKYLSWLLRHGARRQGLAIDEAGWVNISDLLEFAEMSRGELESVMSADQKQRLQLQGKRIRACQGHSLDSGVSREALEASWCAFQADGAIWHGTHTTALELIAHEGLLPGTRTHVHCALTQGSNIGKRAGVDVLLEISTSRLRAAGIDMFVAPNGVVLVRHVPKKAIVGLVPMNSAARRCQADLRTVLGMNGT
ncbi:MAG: RNA 2'-phosphotransferase [Acidobacteria bacterium]|nr:RNA 2'-phosphotransferase [Acidobacteriota bacterium]